MREQEEEKVMTICTACSDAEGYCPKHQPTKHTPDWSEVGPELLEALQALVKCHDKYKEKDGSFEDAYYALAKYAYQQWENARATIAKATQSEGGV